MLYYFFDGGDFSMNSEINYKKIRKYINICKKSQGEYIPGGHPMTSWATTYSDVFVEASARIYVGGFKSEVQHPWIQ